jgi:hypothetical protein
LVFLICFFSTKQEIPYIRFLVYFIQRHSLFRRRWRGGQGREALQERPGRRGRGRGRRGDIINFGRAVGDGGIDMCVHRGDKRGCEHDHNLSSVGRGGGERGRDPGHCGTDEDSHRQNTNHPSAARATRSNPVGGWRKGGGCTGSERVELETPTPFLPLGGRPVCGASHMCAPSHSPPGREENSNGDGLCGSPRRGGIGGNSADN